MNDRPTYPELPKLREVMAVSEKLSEKLPSKIWLLKRIAELKIEIAKRIPGGWSIKSWSRELDLRLRQLDKITKVNSP